VTTSAPGWSSTWAIRGRRRPVCLVDATDVGHGVVDRELYLPRRWTDDPAPCRAASVPQEVGFATKAELARAMIGRALDAGALAAW
jgi:SRSO17 transposase